MAKPLSLTWTKHLKDEDRKKFEQTIRASTTLVERLQQILLEEERALDNQAADFNNPSWPYKQAFLLGDKARLKRIRDLLDF